MENNMKKIGAFLLACLQVTVCQQSAFAQQVVSGATATLNVTGSTNGVQMVNQAPPPPTNTETTLTCPNTFTTINSAGSTASVAVSTDSNGLGNVIFSGPYTVTGSMGASGLSLDIITANSGATPLTFNGDVFASEFDVLTGIAATINFNGSVDLTQGIKDQALEFKGNNATINFGPNVNGNISTFTAPGTGVGGAGILPGGTGIGTLNFNASLTLGVTTTYIMNTQIGLSPTNSVAAINGMSTLSGTSFYNVIFSEPIFVNTNGAIPPNGVNLNGPGTMTFNGSVSISTTSGVGNGNLNFGGNSGDLETANFGTDANLFGNVITSNPFNGNLNLLGGNTVSGSVGTLSNPIFSVGLNQSLPNQVSSSIIQGDAFAQQYNLEINVLHVVGSETFPTPIPGVPSLTVTVLNDTPTGHGLMTTGSTNFPAVTTTPPTTPLPVQVTAPNNVMVSGTPAPVSGNGVLTGNPFIIVNGAPGLNAGQAPNGFPITVTTLDPSTGIPQVRFGFVGSNPVGTGNITLAPFVNTCAASLPPGPGAGAAAALDAAFFGATGDMLVVQTALNALANAQGLAASCAAEASTAPIVNGDLVETSFSAINKFQDMWANNLMRARAANICYTPCDTGLFRNSCCCDNNNQDRRWNGEGVWLDTFGYFPNQKKRHDILGYDADQYGVMLAVQRPLCDNINVGVGGGYAHTKIRGKNDPAAGFSANGSKIETGDATLYVGYNPGCFYVDTFLSGAWNRYDNHRNIAFIGRTAHAKFDGQEYSALVSAGYDLNFGRCFTITPITSVEYTHLHLDGFTETGADALNLLQAAQRYDSLQTGLGAMLGYTINTCVGNLYLEVHAKWLYDCVKYRIRNFSAFAGNPSVVFSTKGNVVERNGAEAGVGATLFTSGNFTLDAQYEYTWRNKYSANEYTISAAYRF